MSALDAVLRLHTSETRYTDSSGEWSVSTADEALEFMGEDDPAVVQTFQVCHHCGQLEMWNNGDGDGDGGDWFTYKDSLWPCATVQAIGGAA